MQPQPYINSVAFRDNTPPRATKPPKFTEQDHAKVIAEYSGFFTGLEKQVLNVEITKANSMTRAIIEYFLQNGDPDFLIRRLKNSIKTKLPPPARQPDWKSPTTQQP